MESNICSNQREALPPMKPHHSESTVDSGANLFVTSLSLLSFEARHGLSAPDFILQQFHEISRPSESVTGLQWPCELLDPVGGLILDIQSPTATLQLLKNHSGSQKISQSLLAILGKCNWSWSLSYINTQDQCFGKTCCLVSSRTDPQS